MANGKNGKKEKYIEEGKFEEEEFEDYEEDKKEVEEDNPDNSDNTQKKDFVLIKSAELVQEGFIQVVVSSKLLGEVGRVYNKADLS